MIYGLIIGTDPNTEERMNLSYEDLLREAADHLLSGEQRPITFWRRCCGSVHTQTMSADTCNRIRELTAGSADKKKDYDNALNNWYLKGKISLAEFDFARPAEECRIPQE